MIIIPDYQEYAAKTPTVAEDTLFCSQLRLIVARAKINLAKSEIQYSTQLGNKGTTSPHLLLHFIHPFLSNFHPFTLSVDRNSQRYAYKLLKGSFINSKAYLSFRAPQTY